MKRSSWVMAGAMGLIVALLAVVLRAEEPAKKADAVKPPWQRLLLGEDARKAAEQETKLTQLLEAGQIALIVDAAVACQGSVLDGHACLHGSLS